MKQKRGVLLMLLCAAMWSIAGLFIKKLPWHPLVIAGGRGVFTTAILFLYMRLAHLRITVNRNSLKVAFPMAALALLFVASNKMTSAANAVVLQYTAPVFVVLFSAFVYRKMPSLLDVAAVLMTFGGIVLFFVDEISGKHMLGNFVAVASGIFMAFMYMSSERVTNEERMTGLMLGHGMTVIVGAVFTAFYPPELNGTTILCISVLGIFQLGIPYVLYGIAAGICSSLACTLIAAVEPLLNPVWVFIFDGEAPGILSIMGAVIVIAAISVWTVLREKSVRTSAE